MLLLVFVSYPHTSVWKTVLQNRPGGIGLFNVQHWLLRLMLYGDWVEQVYSVQPLPSSQPFRLTPLLIKAFKSLTRRSLEMFLRNNQNKTIDKEFVLDFAQEHLTLIHQKHDHYLFTINTEQYDWIRNLFWLMLKCQCRNYYFWSCLLEKIFLNYEITELWN